VDGPPLVQVAEPVERLPYEPNRLRHRQLLAAVEHLVERLAVEELHGDEVPAAALADLVGPDHVRVVELRQQPRLALEPGQQPGVLRAARREDLQGHRLAEGVGGLVHAPHLPLAELFQNLVPLDEEPVGPAAAQERRLPVCDDALAAGNRLHERLDLAVGVGPVRLPPAADDFDLVGGEEFALGQQRAELADRRDRARHGLVRAEG
jgi:hypothetical protein